MCVSRRNKGKKRTVEWVGKGRRRKNEKGEEMEKEKGREGRETD